MAKDLSPDARKAYEQAFKVFDHNGDGHITHGELSIVLRSLGIETSSGEIHDMIRSVDMDGSGTIQLDEFLSLMNESPKVHSHKPRTYSREELKKAFSSLDKDGNGFISTKELKEAMHSLGQSVTLEDVEYMVQEVDKDGDGNVNWNEFLEMMTA